MISGRSLTRDAKVKDQDRDETLELRDLDFEKRISRHPPLLSI